MNQTAIDPLEPRLAQAARHMTYPPTPDIAAGQKASRSHGGWLLRPAFRTAAAIALAVLLLVSLLSIPTVRAAVLEFLQIGAVRIFPQESGEEQLPAETPAATPLYLASLYELGGETTLERARELIGISIPLPAYPQGLGAPDRVFLQDLDGYMVVLVWSDPEQPTQARMSLHIITPGSFAMLKIQPEVIETTRVKEQEAIWAVGPYPLEMKSGNIDIRRIVDGNVLIWKEGEITYRLESTLSLEEAVRVAESLR